MMHTFLRLFLQTALLMTAGLSQAAVPPPKPNIILIYADDMGMGLLGCYGESLVKTPNIDRLAEQGIMFTRCYSSQYCCPARASLLMGVHDSHSKSYSETPGGLVITAEKQRWSNEEFEQKAARRAGIKPSPQEVFLPEMLKKAGYVTAQFGKLDWGFTTWHGELQRHGWDHYVGYMDHVRAHGYYPSFLWKNGERLPLEGNTHADAGKTPENYSQGATEKRRGKREGKVTYAPDVMLRETLKFMEKNRKKPMFIFFSTNLPHGPVDIPPAENIYARNPEIRKAYTNASGGNKECGAAAEEYASMVDKLDRQVEAIVAQVHKLGLEKRTMIIFASDNGHEIYYRTDKGRGRSLDYHGGVVDKNGELLDVFRGNRGKVGLKNAMVNLAGLKWTNHEGGIRVPMIVSWPGTLPHGKVCHSLVANYDHMATFADLAGVRMPAGKDAVSYKNMLLGKPGQLRDYIVIDHTIITGDGWKLTRKNGQWLLFQISRDPEERNNLAEKQPKQLERLQAIYKKEVGSPRKDR
ncbi:sulfatase-like hydrolase/transferase [uncultured Akkermansia sp.]|uniref:sulfatase-like hydrolase/transferase n=1 Tax=Akkermansia sp. TaxID=1872421 RepID=UPI0025E4FBD3|nr:sulfatase-like hydrolase/transferase [uncultured Akkermansia sp.]